MMATPLIIIIKPGRTIDYDDGDLAGLPTVVGSVDKSYQHIDTDRCWNSWWRLGLSVSVHGPRAVGSRIVICILLTVLPVWGSSSSSFIMLIGLWSSGYPHINSGDVTKLRIVSASTSLRILNTLEEQSWLKAARFNQRGKQSQIIKISSVERELFRELESLSPNHQIYECLSYKTTENWTIFLNHKLN